MDCEKARQALLDGVEGLLDEERAGQLSAHVAQCSACAGERRELERGRAALLAAVPLLAPSGGHLTEARLSRLMAARKSAGTGIITLRRFVAAAAAAAILVSAGFIYGDLSRWLSEEDGEAPVRPQAVRVVLTPAGQGGARQVVTGHLVPRQPVFEGPPLQWREMDGIVRASAEGVRVPVRNAGYDPEEADYWW